MKILLVTFQTNTDTIGLKYLHSYLLRNNIDSSLLFIPNYNKNISPVLQKFLQKLKPKIIAISVMAYEFVQAKELSVNIKKYFSNVKILWGGYYPTSQPKNSLKYADYVFLGESEHTLVEFVKNLEKNKPVSNIENLVYKSSDRIFINKKIGKAEDLDKIPFPEHYPKKSFILHKDMIVKLDKSLFRKYARFSGKLLSVTTQRGCVLACSYCYESSLPGVGRKRVSTRSVENVIEEIKLFVREFPDIVYVLIQDDCFFMHSLAWLKEFAKFYKKEIKKKLACQAIPSFITEEKIKVLKDAGLAWLTLGIQSGSEKTLKEIFNRPVTNEHVLNATRLVKKYNLSGIYHVIMDNPYETEEDILKTIDLLLKIPKPYVLYLYSLTFYPGTTLYHKALRDNLKIENPFEKNYRVHKSIFLNKTVRLCPLLPKSFIKLLIKYRNSTLGKALMNVIYKPSILSLEPMVWTISILQSFDYNPFQTVNMISSFARTGINYFWLNKRV